MNTTFSLQCAALLFDLDGVLVDSAACVERVWHDWALRHELDLKCIIALAHGRRTIETVQLVAPHLEAAAEVAALAASESSTTDGVFEVPGARDLLASLPSAAWAVVTSGVRAVASLRIRHTGLPIPSIMICADDIARGKPDPEGYLTAAERLGVPPTACVVIEDAPAGLAAAQAAGMRSIAISGTFAPDVLAFADYTVPRLAALRVAASDNGARLEISVAPT